jgi:hypothetical protein
MARVTVFVREDGRAALPRQFQHESDPAQQLYRAVIRGLRPEQAGALELESSDQLSTERARLRQAAKAEGIALVVRSRAARVLYFWRRPAAPSVDIDPADTDLPVFLPSCATPRGMTSRLRPRMRPRLRTDEPPSPAATSFLRRR